MQTIKHPTRNPYRLPPLGTASRSSLVGLRRKAFAVGREAGLFPSMVKDRASFIFNVRVFDRLSAGQLESLIASFQHEIDEKKRIARRTAEIIDETSKQAVAPLKRSGPRGLASETSNTAIDVDAPPFDQGSPSRFAVGLERIDRGQDVRTGKPLAQPRIADPVMARVMQGILSSIPGSYIVESV